MVEKSYLQMKKHLAQVKIINNNFKFNDEQSKFLKTISKKYNYDYIEKIFNKINKLKVLVIGETIIDQYNFVKH